MTPYTITCLGTDGTVTFYLVQVGAEKVGALLVPQATPEKVARLAAEQVEPWLASR